MDEAQFNLGNLYQRGEVGFPKDEREGVKWYQKSAEQRFPMAQFYLGKAYAEGIGATKDKKRAMEYFKKASEQGHVEAHQHFLLLLAQTSKPKKRKKH